MPFNFFHKEHTGTDKMSSSLDDAVHEAETLKESFLALLNDVMLTAKNIDVDIELVKLHISCFLQFAHQNTPAMQGVLFDLENEVTSLQGAVRFLINRNLLGYLNFCLLNVFEKCFAAKPKLIEKIKQYKMQHDLFIKNSFETIIDVFKSRPDLAPVSPVGLPEIKLELNEKKWKEKSLYQWQEIMQEVGILPDHIMIKSITFNCIIIAFWVLSFFISTIVKKLRDAHVNDALLSVGISCSIDSRVEELASKQNDYINSVIEQANKALEQPDKSVSVELKTEITDILFKDSMGLEEMVCCNRAIIIFCSYFFFPVT